MILRKRVGLGYWSS